MIQMKLQRNMQNFSSNRSATSIRSARHNKMKKQNKKICFIPKCHRFLTNVFVSAH